MKHFRILLLLVIFTVLFEVSVFSQVQFQIEPVEVRRPGESFRIRVKAELKEKWHFYSIKHQGEDAPPPTALTFQNDYFKPFGPAYESRPITAYDKAIDLTLSFHEETAYLYQNFSIPDTLKEGRYPIEIAIRYQLCDDRVCLPPKTESLRVEIPIESGPVRTEFKDHVRTIEEISPERGVSGDHSLLGFILLAAAMGAASLLTPCVFPMIPITISYFTKQASGDRKSVLVKALVFGTGIVATYTGTGLLMSLLLGAGSVGQLASNPWVNLAIGVIFIFFAFSLMGLFELQLPAAWSGFFDSKARMLGGLTGILLMGFTFTLTAFTCTVQFVGTLLISAAYGDWLWPLLGMLVFSSVFAAPFVLLALVPSWVHTFQKQGGSWLGRTKVVLGLLEIMASIKFLSNADLVWGTDLISRNTALGIWSIILLIAAIYLIATAWKKETKGSYGQVIVGMIFLGITLIVVSARNDRSLGGFIDAVLPPMHQVQGGSGNMVSSEELEQLNWLDTLNEALVVAKKENKKVFVDFTGYTCVNCRWMEQNMFPREKVFKQFKSDFVLVRLYTDGGPDKDKNQAMQIERFNTIALPFYVILNSENQVLDTFTGMTYDEKEFIDFLQ